MAGMLSGFDLACCSLTQRLVLALRNLFEYDSIISGTPVQHRIHSDKAGLLKYKAERILCILTCVVNMFAVGLGRCHGITVEQGYLDIKNTCAPLSINLIWRHY